MNVSERNERISPEIFQALDSLEWEDKSYQAEKLQSDIELLDGSGD